MNAQVGLRFHSFHITFMSFVVPWLKTKYSSDFQTPKEKQKTFSI